jgi:hypothetical protein
MLTFKLIIMKQVKLRFQKGIDFSFKKNLMLLFFLLIHYNSLQAESKISGLIYSSTEGISRSNFNQSNSGKNNFLIQDVN